MMTLVDSRNCIFGQLTEEDLMIDEVLSSDYIYEEGLVKLIVNGKSKQACDVSDVVKHCTDVIKIEGYEKLSAKLLSACQEIAKRFNHKGPVTCHLFKSTAESISFPMHKDPDHVLLFMVKGSKRFEFGESKLTALVSENEALYIHANTAHRAINTEDSIMLSFGLEKFIIEKL
jgi:hypothetical protein